MIAGAVAYAACTFAGGYAWHLVLFKQEYLDLNAFQPEPILPLGALAVVLQAILFSWIHSSLAWRNNASLVRRGLVMSAVMFASVSSVQVLATGAKSKTTCLPGFIAIEAAYCAVQFLVSGFAVALASGGKQVAKKAS
jgi:hypothetical protein